VLTTVVLVTAIRSRVTAFHAPSTLNPDFRGRENNQAFWGRKPRFLRALAISALGSLIVNPDGNDTIGIKSTLALL
jgi:hypothetical protein